MNDDNSHNDNNNSKFFLSQREPTFVCGQYISPKEHDNPIATGRIGNQKGKAAGKTQKHQQVFAVLVIISLLFEDYTTSDGVATLAL